MEIKIDDAELNSTNLEFVLCVILHITRRRSRLYISHLKLRDNDNDQLFITMKNALFNNLNMHFNET